MALRKLTMPLKTYATMEIMQSMGHDKQLYAKFKDNGKWWVIIKTGEIPAAYWSKGALAYYYDGTIPVQAKQAFDQEKCRHHGNYLVCADLAHLGPYLEPEVNELGEVCY